MRAMIMAAGLGTRLRPLTEFLPKPMVPLGGRPAIEHILRLLHRHGITEVVMNLHHLPETMTSYFGDGSGLGMDVRYSFEPELLGTAGGVKNVETFFGGESFLVMSGDALTDIDLTALLQTHRARGGVATLAVKEVDDPSHYGVVVVDGAGRAVGFQEKPAAEEARSHLCNCGIYVFEPWVLGQIPAGFYDFGSQFLPRLLAEQRPVFTFAVDSYWNDVGSLLEYRRGNFATLTGKAAVELPAREVRPGVWLGPHALLAEEARVEGPVLVGAGSRVEAGAHLIGPALLGEQVVIEAEALIERSILWDAVFVGGGGRVQEALVARSTHVRAGAGLQGAVIGERCVIGEGSRIGDSHVEPNTVLGKGSRVA